MKMDSEKLISYVYEREALWNMKSKNYHMRDVQRKLWNEVSEAIGFTVEETKKRWRSMRDTFRKEYQKMKTSKSGDGADSSFQSKWPFFEMLMFLSDNIERRELQSNIPSPSEKQDSELSEIENLATETSKTSDISMEEESMAPPTKDRLSTSRRLSSKRQRPQQNVEDKLLEIEKEKLKLLERGDKLKEDSDYQFLLSLLPYLCKVQSNRKDQNYTSMDFIAKSLKIVSISASKDIATSSSPAFNSISLRSYCIFILSSTC